MGACRVQPEDRLARLVVVREVVCAATRDGQLDPVLDWKVLDLARPPDVASGDLVPHEHEILAILNDANRAVELGLESSRVGAILLGLLSHETDIGTCPHGLGVESAVLLAEVNALAEDPSIATVRDGGQKVLLLVIGVPHLAPAADGCGHGVVNDDVAGDVEVGDALVRVDHGDLRTLRVRRCEIILDDLLLVCRQAGDLLVDVTEAVVGIHAQGREGALVLLENILEVGFDAMSEHDGI
mmetsp:Transcript_20289/g.41667  ORF Transcript_20289/g.41667 Transcript_20289/m.41667 type:complete len:241 (+) Transcript_20289:1086-1808(+)